MVNLITKYGKRLDTSFVRKSVVEGKTSKRFDWTGAKSIRIMHMVTVPLNDFNRTANGNRFGTPKNIQDEVQEFTVRFDKSYPGTIDRGDNTQQGMLKKFGAWVKDQDNEQVIPWFDRMALTEWAHHAGLTVPANSVTASNIVDVMATVEKEMNNNHVPKSMRFTYVGESQIKALRLADEWRYCDTAVYKMLAKGQVGFFGTLPIIAVSDYDMPQYCPILVARKDSVFAPTQMKTANLYKRVQGYDGPVGEFRRIGDAFVSWSQCKGVVAVVTDSKQESAPTISVAGQITVPSNKKVAYTLDGSDPRYSFTATIISSTATPTHTAGQTIKAVVIDTDGAYANDNLHSTPASGNYCSNVAEKLTTS